MYNEDSSTVQPALYDNTFRSINGWYAGEGNMVMTREALGKAIDAAGAKVARLTLKGRLVSQEDVFEAFTNELEGLHNSTFDVNVGNLRDAAKVWLLKKPKRKAKAEAVDTAGMVYLLG